MIQYFKKIKRTSLREQQFIYKNYYIKFIINSLFIINIKAKGGVKLNSNHTPLARHTPHQHTQKGTKTHVHTWTKQKTVFYKNSAIQTRPKELYKKECNNTSMLEPCSLPFCNSDYICPVVNVGQIQIHSISD